MSPERLAEIRKGSMWPASQTDFYVEAWKDLLKELDSRGRRIKELEDEAPHAEFDALAHAKDALEQRLAAAEADTARLDWLGDMCCGNVRGTDFPEWSIQGKEHADIRDSIDESIDATRKEGKP